MTEDDVGTDNTTDSANTILVALDSSDNNINNSVNNERGVWSPDEHDRFLAAMRTYPDGPWRAIADAVGSRSARQVQTHAQKYFAKVARRVRGLRKDRRRVARTEHRLDDDMAELFRDMAGGSRIRGAIDAANRADAVVEVDTIGGASASTAVAIGGGLNRGFGPKTGSQRRSARTGAAGGEVARLAPSSSASLLRRQDLQALAVREQRRLSRTVAGANMDLDTDRTDHWPGSIGVDDANARAAIHAPHFGLERDEATEKCTRGIGMDFNTPVPTINTGTATTTGKSVDIDSDGVNGLPKDVKEASVVNQRHSDDDSDSSLSGLDDDDLAFLLQLLASGEYDTTIEAGSV